MKYISKSYQETQKIAAELVQNHPNGGVFCLYGDLGAGKTTFTKGFAESLGIEKRSIKSPTFTIVREYELDGRQDQSRLYHYDFYRHEQAEPILMQQFAENCAEPSNYIILEWANHIQDFLPENRIDIHMEHGKTEDERIININEA